MGIISNETITNLLDKSNIVDIIQSYVPLKVSGSNYRAICPFHDEKTPSFNVNPLRQIFHCFGCGVGGDVIKFIMLYENLSFPEAVNQLANKLGITIQEENLSSKEYLNLKNKKVLKELQNSYAKWLNLNLFKSIDAQEARDYLKKRGISMEIARSWNLGFAPESQSKFLEWSKKQKFTLKMLVDAGFAKYRDEINLNNGVYPFFRNRLMFPVYDAYGDIIAFSGRVVSKEYFGGKYINSPQTVLFDKSKVFFGLHKSKRYILKQKQAIVMEGQFDIISSYENGIKNVIAPLGTAFTSEHASVIKRFTDEIVFCFDSDQAGLSAVRKAFREVAPKNFSVRIASLPKGEDPDSVIDKKGLDYFNKLISESSDFFDFCIDKQEGGLNHGSIRDKLKFVDELMFDIVFVKDKILQDSLISRISTKLRVGEDEIRKLFANAVRIHDNNKFKEQKLLKNVNKKYSKDSKKIPYNNVLDNNYNISDRSIKVLCKVLLTDSRVRTFITKNDVPDFFDSLKDTELLSYIWKSDINLDNPSSINTFKFTLPENQQIFLRNLIYNKSENITIEIAQECLNDLHKKSIKNKMNAVTSELQDQSINIDKVVSLQKQLLNLKEELNNI